MGACKMTAHRCDLVVENHGSVFILQPLTARAREWLELKYADDHDYAFMWYAGGLACEPRCAPAIVEAMVDEGMEVE